MQGEEEVRDQDVPGSVTGEGQDAPPPATPTESHVVEETVERTQTDEVVEPDEGTVPDGDPGEALSTDSAREPGQVSEEQEAVVDGQQTEVEPDDEQKPETD